MSQQLLLDIEIAPGTAARPRFCESLLREFFLAEENAATPRTAADILENFAAAEEFSEWMREPCLPEILSELAGGGFLAADGGAYLAAEKAQTYRAENYPAADYAAVFRRMQSFAAGKQHGLMEEFALEAARIILAEFAAESVRVYCRKPRPFAALGEAGAEITVRRGG